MSGNIVDQLGLVGIAVGGGLNAMGLPVPAEVLLPLGGVAARQGQLPLAGVLVAAYIGQMVAAVLTYLIARHAGIEVIERYSKYLFIDHRVIVKAQKLFNRHGKAFVLVGAFVPGPQWLVGYVAGMAQLKFGKFITYAAIGKAVWVSWLVGLGYMLGANAKIAEEISKYSGAIMVIAVGSGAIWYIGQRRKAGQHRPAARKRTTTAKG